MAKKLQLRGGTTAQHSSFTGALREVTVDTDKDILVVHDGATAGGFPAHRDLKGADIASADPLVIVTGTTGFNDMTVAANTHFFLEFAGALVMTHVGGALDLPSGAAITTAAGDVGEFFSTAANVVTCVNYTKASGKSPVESVTLANSVTLTNKTLTAPAVTDLTGSMGAITLGGAVTGADQLMTAVSLKDYGEATNIIGSIGGGTQSIDLTLGNSVTATLDTSTTTFTFDNPSASGTGCGFTLILSTPNNQTIVWPASVDWNEATAPDLSAGALPAVLTFWTVDAGTIWYGFLSSSANA